MSSGVAGAAGRLAASRERAWAVCPRVSAKAANSLPGPAWAVPADRMSAIVAAIRADFIGLSGQVDPNCRSNALISGESTGISPSCMHRRVHRARPLVENTA